MKKRFELAYLLLHILIVFLIIIQMVFYVGLRERIQGLEVYTNTLYFMEYEMLLCDDAIDRYHQIHLNKSKIDD